MMMGSQLLFWPGTGQDKGSPVCRRAHPCQVFLDIPETLKKLGV